MAERIEVMYTIPDTRAEVRKQQLRKSFPNIKDVSIADVFTLDLNVDGKALDKNRSMDIAGFLSNKVIQSPQVSPHNYTLNNGFDWAIEVGFLPGVTDNVGNTSKETAEDMFGIKFSADDHIYTSQMTLLSGNLTRNEVEQIAHTMFNPVIQRVHIKSKEEYGNGGMGLIVPKVKLSSESSVDIVDLLGVSDEELAVIGRKGVANKDGTRRGPLAMDISYMKAVKEYFRAKERNPTDIELEMIAQSWSEHCRHPKFSDPIDEITEGLFKRYIKAATEQIRRDLGNDDFCISVFTDNSGAINFNKDFLITHKVETHNSPSALDPFGGAITGIVGVNRDTIGFGMGAKPIANVYGFCFGNPHDKTRLFRDKEFTQELLPRRAIQDGVISGVNVGGNCSGIPTPQGFAYHDDRYAGKPLVFVGTVGLIPKMSSGKPAHEKGAVRGDYIVMTGGKVGQDGIHGATFSSEALTSGSPSTAVQIGDPITQKKMSDAIIKEARDLGLYHSITDNGAGGLSSSVGEMAHESGGCYVTLEKVPLKYPGLEPWKIWVSESQERMTLAVPPEKWKEFSDLMERRGVEATIIGEFTSSGKCIVDYKDRNVLDLDMEFLKNGLPKTHIITEPVDDRKSDPILPKLEDLTRIFNKMLSRQNIASKEYISQQFDHEVQGGSVVKPLQGRGRVNGDATVLRPLLDSMKGVVLSHALYPSYSDISTYHMAAASIDTAIRNAVVVGADPNRLALLDNFCWASPDDPKNMYRLKEACRACYDFATGFKTPFISGKDSMYNDFKGFDEKGNPLKISVPLTLLISSMGVMDDVTKAVTMDAKMPGDKVYVLGLTKDELGGSEYYEMMGTERLGKLFMGSKVPIVDLESNIKTYRAMAKGIEQNLVASATSVNRGGLGVALARTAMAGLRGMNIWLEEVPSACLRDDQTLYSESQGRIVATVCPDNKERFESLMKNEGVVYSCIGEVAPPLLGSSYRSGDFRIGSSGRNIVDTNLNEMLSNYRTTFGDF